MNEFALFLAGRYLERDFPFYRRLARERVRIAVDGGYRYFARSHTVPHILIGDFDSLGGVPMSLTSKTEIVRHPTQKDKTDTELALDYALERGAEIIDIIQPAIGEPDHFLANLFLLARRSRRDRDRATRIRLIGPRFEAFRINNSRHEFKRAVGSTASIIPISASIKLSWSGTAYDVTKATIRRGSTHGTRNRIISNRAAVKVEGEAFLVRLTKRL